MLKPKKRSFGIKKRRYCRFCMHEQPIDYKDMKLLQMMITERGKIVPRRLSGNCAKHQREVAHAVKRAREIALIPYVAE